MMIVGDVLVAIKNVQFDCNDKPFIIKNNCYVVVSVEPKLGEFRVFDETGWAISFKKERTLTDHEDCVFITLKEYRLMKIKSLEL